MNGPAQPPGVTGEVSIPGYRLLERIGIGSSADVFRAQSLATRAFVAIKVWRWVPDPKWVQKFRQERELHQRLADSPQVVALLDWGLPDDGVPWLVMDLYDDSLLSLLAGDRPLDEELARVIAIDVLDGLAVIHVAQHVHRDVKPANVLIRSGRAALGDLGISMEVDGHTVHAAAGTFPYVAPELCTGAAPTYRSDVFSAGQTLRRIFGPAAAGPVVAVLDRATSVDPGDRHPSAHGDRHHGQRRRSQQRHMDQR